MQYTNPIIPGFHPDPSICRVGDDFFLVTSTFEYFPGVPVYHSRDMINWRCIGHCLTRDEQLPLHDARPSSGIWAPTIRHHQGRYYMVTTNMAHGGNFFVTADTPEGPWSDPFYFDPDLFDPSFLFDEGHLYVQRRAQEDAIVQYELDIETGIRIGEPKTIWEGTSSGTEGSHLYRIGNRYYLMTAEAGTHRGHIETIARSNSPWGPFEACPHNPILTHRDDLFRTFQACGHGDLVELQDGSWWMVFLAIRPHSGLCTGFHHLGRETFLAPVRWTADGWPVVGSGGMVDVENEGPGLPAHPWPVPPVRGEFNRTDLASCWNFLRNPCSADWSLAERPGHLRLHGSSVGLDDHASPSWIGRRQQHFNCRAATKVEFEPRAETEEAGLTVYMHANYHYDLAITVRDGRRVVCMRRRVGDITVESCTDAAPGPLVLELEADTWTYRFRAGSNACEMNIVGTGATKFLSTEVAGGFTGVYIGLYATGNGSACASPADFSWFDYEELQGH